MLTKGRHCLLLLPFLVSPVSRAHREGYHNPASPAALAPPLLPSDISRADSATPTAASMQANRMRTQSHHSRRRSRSPTASMDSPRSPPTPVSPAVTRSTTDLHDSGSSSHQENGERVLEWDRANGHHDGMNGTGDTASSYVSGTADGLDSLDEVAEKNHEMGGREV